MEFALSPDQQLIVETARLFTSQELMPYEEEVESTGRVRDDLVDQIRKRSIEAGIYAANMPSELGGGGLDSLTMTLVDRELGATSYALHYIVARPSNILRACVGEQIEDYLLPTIRGDRVDCLAMSEPDAGSDIRGMKCTAVPDGDEFVVNGTKHFISHADLADYVILFAATGEEDSTRGPRKLITSFLVDLDAPGLTVSMDEDDEEKEIRFQTRMQARSLKRLETPQDLVGAVLFLCSSDSDFMTGQTMVVDGGAQMH